MRFRFFIIASKLIVCSNYLSQHSRLHALTLTVASVPQLNPINQYIDAIFSVNRKHVLD